MKIKVRKTAWFTATGLCLVMVGFFIAVGCCKPPPPPQPYTPKKYVIGNHYNVNGVQGIVYKLNEGDTSGMIVSLDEGYCQWADSLNANFETNTRDGQDGTKNMEKIKELDIDNYPAFKWCDEKNSGSINGWYLPALHELDEIRKIANHLNDTLMTIKEGVVFKLTYHWSSTGADIFPECTEAWIIVFLSKDIDMGPTSLQMPKTGRYFVRAVRSF